MALVLLKGAISRSSITALRIMLLAMALGIAGCAQEAVDLYSMGAALFSAAGCPVFVGGIAVGSPAERAGIRAGDQVLAVGGTPIKDLRQATRLLRSERPLEIGTNTASNLVTHVHHPCIEIGSARLRG
jgi:S1-C subfamily serine protease